MGTTVQLMTFEEFAKLPEDGFRYELRHGELVRIAHARQKHTRVQYRFRNALMRICQGLGEVGTEFPYRPLPEYEYRLADVAYISQARWDTIDPEVCLQGAPELVIEVLSPSNSAAEIEDLQNLCLENGSKEFWTANVDLRQRGVTTPDGVTITYKSGQEIPLRLFGGGALKVDEIFG